RGLATSGRTRDGDELPRLNDQTEVLQHKRPGFRIAEEYIAKLDASFNGTNVGQHLVVPTLEFAERYIAETFQMQLEDAEVERLFDQLHSFFYELPFVAHECENHPDRERVGQRHSGCKINSDDVFKPEDRVVDGAKGDLRSAQADVGAHHIGIAVQPLPLPIALAIEQLESLNCTQRLNEGGTLLRFCL